MTSTDQNKKTVRRWMTEVLEGGKLDLMDEVLAPNYVNVAMGGTNRSGMTELLGQIRKAATMRFIDIDLTAEGDSVVARFNISVERGGEKHTAQGLTYYRMAGGKIAVDDPFTRPDLAQMLGMAPPAR